MRRAGLGFALVALAVGAAACGATSGGGPNASKLLGLAKTTLDATPSVHFSITSKGASGGTGITGGQGSLVRPAGITGTFDLNYGGLPLTIQVEAEGARFYAKLPFSSKFKAADPAKYDLGNPEQLFSTTHGLSGILAGAKGAKLDGTTRLSGELLDKVSGSVPGADIPVIPDLAPSKPVSLLVAIDPTSHQVRQVTLVGPFVSATASTTYVVTLTGYGQPVSVSLPSP
ncbi:MAG: LppX_LprAFG lipoprotein [Acidimicrobiales bacterium]